MDAINDLLLNMDQEIKKFSSVWRGGKLTIHLVRRRSGDEDISDWPAIRSWWNEGGKDWDHRPAIAEDDWYEGLNKFGLVITCDFKPPHYSVSQHSALGRSLKKAMDEAMYLQNRLHVDARKAGINIIASHQDYDKLFKHLTWSLNASRGKGLAPSCSLSFFCVFNSAPVQQGFRERLVELIGNKKNGAW